jgi:hypothetical protein
MRICDRWARLFFLFLQRLFGALDSSRWLISILSWYASRNEGRAASAAIRTMAIISLRDAVPMLFHGFRRSFDRAQRVIYQGCSNLAVNYKQETRRTRVAPKIRAILRVNARARLRSATDRRSNRAMRLSVSLSCAAVRSDSRDDRAAQD